MYADHGIMAAMGDFLGSYSVASGATWEKGTDYRDPVQLKNMLLSVESMVLEFKDEPWLLMWIIGNENNLTQFTKTNAAQCPKEYAQFVERVARRIHELDPNHPVCLCNGDTVLIEKYATYAPSVDIFGANCYRGKGFGDLWDTVARVYDKPVILTEFGIGTVSLTMDEVEDESIAAEVHKADWEDIEAHMAGKKTPGNALGGFAFEWVDNWWYNDMPFQHNANYNPGGWNLEHNGITSQGDGSCSPTLRHLKKTYQVYQSLWK
jgi:beta-glucuronidase